MEYGMENFQNGMDMEWKKFCCMEYGKMSSIPFLSMPWSLVVANRNKSDISNFL